MRWLASPYGHEHRVQHEFLGHCGLCGLADNAAGLEIHHDGQIELALPGAHVRDVGDPELVWAGDGKPSLQCIGRQKGCGTSGGPRGVVAVEGLDVIRPHNPGDSMLATGLARCAQIEKDPWGTVDTVAHRLGRADQTEQSLILYGSSDSGLLNHS